MADLALLRGGADDRDGPRTHDPPHRLQHGLGILASALGGDGGERDPGIHGQQSVTAGDDRVEVDFRDLGGLRDQLGDADDDAGQRVPIDGRLSADAVERRGPRDLAQHLPRALDAHGRERERHVLQRLDQGSAHAEHDDLAEGRVRRRADHELAPGVRHRLDEHSLGLRVGHRRCSGGDSSGVLEAERDAAHVGLVRDLRGRA